MTDVKIEITEEDINRALADAGSLPERPVVVSATYSAQFDLIVLHLSTGRRLVIPREDVQQLQNAAPTQLEEIKIYAGVNVSWPQLDVDLYLPYLLEGRLGTDAWMQSLNRPRIAA